MFVLPSTGFEPTPLIHCSTIRLALCQAPQTTRPHIYIAANLAVSYNISLSSMPALFHLPLTYYIPSTHLVFRLHTVFTIRGYSTISIVSNIGKLEHIENKLLIIQTRIYVIDKCIPRNLSKPIYIQLQINKIPFHLQVIMCCEMEYCYQREQTKHISQ